MTRIYHWSNGGGPENFGWIINGRNLRASDLRCSTWEDVEHLIGPDLTKIMRDPETSWQPKDVTTFLQHAFTDEGEVILGEQPVITSPVMAGIKSHPKVIAFLRGLVEVAREGAEITIEVEGSGTIVVTGEAGRVETNGHHD